VVPSQGIFTVIVHQGRDAWAEDDAYIAMEAVARGWHCLPVDGPGMGQALRLQGLPFRPDWEKSSPPWWTTPLPSRG